MSFSWSYLLHGFYLAFTPLNLLYALIGSVVGTLVGVLPGIGPTSAIAILLPLTTVLPPIPAIIMMAAIYYGAMYGGSTTAIVVNIPGEASSVPTAMDGYQLARQGRGGPALGVAAISSFVAGTLSLVGLTFFAPLLANVALAFGPPEYFALMFMALSLVISLSGRALLKGLIATALGLLVAMIGLDPLTGEARLTFGTVSLMAGVNFISVIIGLFAIGEVLVNVERAVASIYENKIRDWLPTKEDLKQSWGAMLRSSVIGFFLGLLPGCSPAVTTFIAYDAEKKVSKRPHLFGHGAIEGVAAAEGANNATCSGGFVPLFSFGIPSGPALAVLLGGFMMYGLQPGPMLFKENPDLVWAVIASMYLGNVILLVLNLPLVGLWARIALIPFPILGPMIILFSVIGAYSVRFLMFDVWVALIFGVLGYLMRKLGFPLAPMVLATVLAQMLETSLKQSLVLSNGSPLIFFTRPIAAVFMLLAVVMIAWGLWLQFSGRGAELAADDSD
ncbi:Tripartite tricarboxylate transporter TctA family protein [Neomoorella glycerini]|uniref:Tripartite tricarboxylate transporter TctA family protein n=1 Tax=Neomoorella glycerini TaxID=55779 RepID=A0A6I5ZU50_9FIRM|nr:tripartite tricarboxylate transporter permease [Moorella glycerini]QGP92911.1 Tripartite tricarboxylate transporter TctA family protein [Moorella glycerini]